MSLQYTFPVLCGGKMMMKMKMMTFHPNEGHLYGSDKSQSCADSVLSLTKPTSNNYCDAKTGKNCHDHSEISRDSLEYETICWGCLLQILNGGVQETIDQSVKFVVSMWPHKLSIPDLTKSIIDKLSGLYKILSRYNGVRSKKKFLSHFGAEKYEEFRTFLLSFRPNYWSDPVLVGTEGNPS